MLQFTIDANARKRCSKNAQQTDCLKIMRSKLAQQKHRIIDKMNLDGKFQNEPKGFN